MRVLGLDLGDARIGLALSDPEGRIAFPAGVLPSQGRKKDVAELKRWMAERAVERVVVGLPLHMDGRSGDRADAARLFATALATATGLPVDTLDERWTSLEAERSLRETGALAREHRRSKRRRRGGSSQDRRSEKGAVDEVAATIILRTYLERQTRAPIP
jgi:putative Holliday junction resolvase